MNKVRTEAEKYESRIKYQRGKIQEKEILPFNRCLYAEIKEKKFKDGSIYKYWENACREKATKYFWCFKHWKMKYTKEEK